MQARRERRPLVAVITIFGAGKGEEASKEKDGEGRTFPRPTAGKGRETECVLQCASCSIAAFGLFHYENYSMERKSGDLASGLSSSDRRIRQCHDLPD